MAFKAASVGTPLNPFSDFLDTSSTGGKWENEIPLADITKRAVIAFSAGNFSVTPNSPGNATTRGLTASGLYGILKVAETSGVSEVQLPTLSSLNPTGKDTTTDAYVFDTPTAFVGHLNNIHNNINNIIRQFIPASTWTAVDSVGELEAPSASFSTVNAFNFVNNILFPGSYTGNTTTAVLPLKAVTTPGSLYDYIGKGITGAFTNLDTINREYQLSRTGIEFYTALTALAYGAKVIIGGNYNLLSSFSQPTSLSNGITPLDAFITLDMSTYIDGQGITSASSNSRLVYGGSENAYALGNTFNFCHGLTAQWLNSVYTEITKRNNLVVSSLDDNSPITTKSAYIIHAGLSGADISIAQNSLDNTFTDVYRYPGFNGQPSLYQNIINTAGLTSYTLIEEPYLNRLMCVMGKKKRTIQSNNFGHPATKTLILEIPLVADVAGSIQRAKANNSIYQSSVGNINSKVLNVDTITPTIVSGSGIANLLQQRRVNYYVQGTNGYILSTDLVGATAQSITIEDRIGVTSMKRVITQLAQDILDNFVASNVPNDGGTRTGIVTSIINAINNNTGLNNSLNTNLTTVVVNPVTNDNSLITVAVTFYPKQASFGTTVGGVSNLTGYTLTVTASA